MSRKSRRRLATVALCAGLLSTACSANGSTAPPADPAPRGSGLETARGFASRLRQGSSCPALLAELRDTAAERVGAYGLGRERSPATTAASGRAQADVSAAPAERSGGSTYSTTNVQELGVDEPDLVKSDGQRLLVVSKGRLFVLDIASGAPKLVGSTAVDRASFLGTELLVAGDRALVFGRHNTPRPEPVPLPGPAARPAIAEEVAPMAVTTTIVEVDLATPETPRVARRLEVEGSYLTARQVGSTARVVVNSSAAALPFVYPQSSRGERAAKEANRNVVRESTLDDWLPSYTLRDASGATLNQGLLTDCPRVHTPGEFAGFGSLSILTLDMAKPLGSGDAVSVITDARVAYASTGSLYVTTTEYVAPEEQDQAPSRFADYATSVHAFDITGQGAARYTASGRAPGHVLNQFSLSEFDGNLRIATTKGAPWGGGSESLITVLARKGDKLEQVGQVGGMGKGERIYSVRYANEIAYVVTFRQTDPFYTVDLSDPKAPKVLGELKIPGYSGYLHPVSATRVLGVGQEADERGRVQGTKVSLFDVSNLAAPKELSTWKLANANSSAEFDHRAFLYWDARKIAVLPVNARVADRGGSQTFSGAVVLSVDPSGIREIGRVSHGDEAIARSLVAADRLFTVSPGKVQASSFADLASAGSVRLG